MHTETISANRAMNATGISVGISVVLVVLGMAAMLVSAAVSVTISILILWIIVFAGLAHLVHAWDVRGTPLFAWRLLVGLVYVAGGLFLLAHPRYDLAFLALFIAWMFGLESMLLLGAYGWLRRLPGAGWLAVDALGTLAVATAIGFLWPWMGIWLLGMLVGINIVCTGAASLALTLGRGDLLAGARQ